MNIHQYHGVNVAALTSGLRITNKLLECWGQGCVELYQQVSDWALVVTEEQSYLSAAIDEHEESWPGVFAYEVTEEVGSRLRRRLMQGDEPSHKHVSGIARALILDFCLGAGAGAGKVITTYLSKSDAASLEREAKGYKA